MERASRDAEHALAQFTKSLSVTIGGEQWSQNDSSDLAPVV
jgi:hypothetical protein